MRRFTTWAKAAKKPLAALVWLGAWQILSMALHQELLLVSPVRAVGTLIELMGSAAFYRAALFSLGRIAAGFGAAVLLGLPLAALATRFSAVRALLAPPMHAVKATPVASIVILLLLWFGAGRLSAAISFLMALPILYTNVLSGLLGADKRLLEMARVFHLSLWKRARSIYAPAAFPGFRAACSLAVGMCWKAGVAAEVIGLPDGSVGMALYQAKVFLSTPELFAWTLAVVLLSVGFEKGVMALLRLLGRRLS